MAVAYLAANIITGLSSDTKPTNVKTGSFFIETDTQLLYVFNVSWVQCQGAIKLLGSLSNTGLASYSLSGLAASNFLIVQIKGQIGGANPTGGFVRFNNDSGAHYDHKYDQNFGGAIVTATSATKLDLPFGGSANGVKFMGTFYIDNINRVGWYEYTDDNANGIGFIPIGQRGAFKFTNGQITEVDLLCTGVNAVINSAIIDVFGFV